LGTTGVKFRNFDYSSQQHGSRRVSKYIYQRRSRCDRRSISQRVQHQREYENYLSIFTTRSERVVNIIYIAGVAVSATTEEHSITTAGDSVENITKRPERTEMNIGTDAKSDETREYNSNESGTENPVVPRMRDRHQSPIFTGVTRISTERRKRRRRR
jgi:hypothetical protein